MVIPTNYQNDANLSNSETPSLFLRQLLYLLNSFLNFINDYAFYKWFLGKWVLSYVSGRRIQHCGIAKKKERETGSSTSM